MVFMMNQIRGVGDTGTHRRELAVARCLAAKWKTATARIAGCKGWTSGQRGTMEVAEPCSVISGPGGGRTMTVDGQPVQRKTAVQRRRFLGIVGRQLGAETSATRRGGDNGPFPRLGRR
jgi:hypothetical protein